MEIAQSPILHAAKSQLKRVPLHIVYDNINIINRYFNYHCSVFIRLVLFSSINTATSVHLFNTYELK